MAKSTNPIVPQKAFGLMTLSQQADNILKKADCFELAMAAETYYKRDAQHRPYHNWGHALSTAAYVVWLGCAEPAVLLAAYWHDAIYERKVRPGFNEYLTENYLYNEWERLGKPDVNFVLSGRWIRLTELRFHLDMEPGHFNLTPEPHLMDADLASLAEHYTTFHSNQLKLVQESGKNPEDPEARKAGAEVLKAFLAKPTIFRTPKGQKFLEPAARSNITRYLEELASDSKA